MAGELATQLRQKREERGLSPQEVCRQTHIPDLSEGQGDPRLPADSLYLVPFLRAYARLPDLDPAETVARSLADIPKTTTVEGVPRQASRPFVRPIVVGLVVLVLLVLGGYFSKDSRPWLESLGNSPGSR